MSKIEDHFLFFSNQISDTELVLDEEETRHIHSVLRLNQDDTIFITDGKGRIFLCRIERIDKKTCFTRIISEKAQNPPSPAMHFFIGLPDKENFEAALTGLVPLGVTAITPVQCTHCRKDWWTKSWEKNRQRFEKKMITAAKQSWNAWFPALNQPVDINQVTTKASSLILVGDDKGKTLSEFNDTSLISNGISCFIGPPGGFSDEEIALLNAKGAQSIILSTNRLRTELAAVILAGNIVQRFGNL